MTPKIILYNIDYVIKKYFQKRDLCFIYLSKDNYNLVQSLIDKLYYKNKEIFIQIDPYDCSNKYIFFQYGPGSGCERYYAELLSETERLIKEIIE